MKDVGHIYFIQADGTPRYKIGLTTRGVQDRLKELNSSQSAYPLALIDSVQVSGVKAVERQLHQDFQYCRVHGEWFEFTQQEVSQVRSRMLALKQAQGLRATHPSSVSFSPPRISFQGWILPFFYSRNYASCWGSPVSILSST